MVYDAVNRQKFSKSYLVGVTGSEKPVGTQLDLSNAATNEKNSQYTHALIHFLQYCVDGELMNRMLALYYDPHVNINSFNNEVVNDITNNLRDTRPGTVYTINSYQFKKDQTLPWNAVKKELMRDKTCKPQSNT